VNARHLAIMAVSVIAVAALVASATASTVGRSANPVASSDGKVVYRQFCGACHALTKALAAGFGGASGLGTNGGPSFNRLQVPYSFSMQAITEPTGGHAIVQRRIKWSQLTLVARYIAQVTKGNPIAALPTDG
jgi:mono/diheme cytochrome c family protein